MKKINWILLILTPLFFLLTHYLAFFIHEYSHSFSAWAFGFKANPLALNYGDTSWQNLLFLSKVDENVDFKQFSSAHPWIAAFIAFAGFGVGNVFLFIVSIVFLKSASKHTPIYYYFFIWLACMNLGNFLDYVPGRTFATHGDIGEITTFLQISPWWIMIWLGYPVCFSVWYFYSSLLPFVYEKLEFNVVQQFILLALITFTLFVLFGATGLHNYGPESHLIALLSIYVVPIVMVACGPWRKWTQRKINDVKK